MSDRPIFNPSRLTEEEFRRKLASENVMEKFEAISYEVQELEPAKFSYLRLVAYLEWFFDKVIEKKVPDKIAQERLLKMNFDNKMQLMKNYELLIDDNYHDVKLIKEIRNDIAHSLLFDQNEIDQKLRTELANYNKDGFEDLHPFDRCAGIVIDIMSLFANAINTNFDYFPTKKKK